MIPIKSAREIEKMRAACRTASNILDRLSDLVRPGISTKEVDQAAADLMQEAGVQSAFLGYRLGHRVFPGNICISLNDEIVHGIGGPRRIQYFCGSLKALCSERSVLLLKMNGSAIFAPRSKMKRCKIGSLWSANSSGME